MNADGGNERGWEVVELFNCFFEIEEPCSKLQGIFEM